MTMQGKTIVITDASNWNLAALDDAVKFAGDTNTAQLCIRYRGEPLVDEIYDPAPVDVYAVQKGLLSLLIGMAEEQYLLEVLDNVNHHLDPAWTQLSPWDEASLTIRCLLTMTTGMDDALAPLGEIGKTWRYNNTAYNYLKKILERHTGLSLNELTRQWLLAPLHMNNTQWIDRDTLLPDGRPFSGLSSTAADLAKLGTLVLNSGRSFGEVLVPAHYIDTLSKPGSQENPAWGLCWWNNNQTHFKLPMREHKRVTGVPLSAAPPDLIAARGALENGLYVVPSLDLVVARTARPGAPIKFEQPFWDLLAKAWPNP